MHPRNLIVSFVTLLVLCATPSTHAVLQYVSFTVRTTTQNDGVVNGTNTTIAPPVIQTHTTADLLSILARDKKAQGNWPSNSFPANAKLAITNNTFVVVSGTNILIDISDILRLTNGNSQIFSGRTNNLTGLSSPATTRLFVGTFTFDDTNITGGAHVSFFLRGVVTRVETDSAVVNSVYKQTVIAKLTNGAGEGIDSDGRQFVCTGTVTIVAHGTAIVGP
jgi:hypothetical protein